MIIQLNIFIILPKIYQNQFKEIIINIYNNMGAGLLQLLLSGQFNNILFDNPKISFFNYAYKRHTNFAMENIKHYFINAPSMLNDMHNGGDYTVKLDGNKSDIDLLSNTCLVFELPNVYSSNQYKFKWIDNIGCMIIKNASIRIDNSLIENINGEWLYVWNELTSTNKESFNNMTGKVDALNNPRKPETTMRIENNIISDYDYPSSDKSNSEKPSIAKRNLIIPLPFWFSKHPSLALPLIKLSNKNITLKIEFENIENLYTVYSPIYNMNISPFHYNEIHDENISINNFISNNNFYAYVEATYIVLDTYERKLLIDSSVNEYLFETMICTNNIISGGNNANRTIDIKSHLQIKEIIWTLKRKDVVDNFNDYFNYSYSIPYNSESSILKNASIIWDKGNVNARVDDKDAIFYNIIQPYQYHSCIPKQGIYSYNYSLYPEKWFPSGSYNSANITTKLYLNLNQYPINFIDSIYDKFKNIINSDSKNNIIYNVYTIQYNILSFNSGTVGLKFQN
jgi:hypothetical protein